ncbi:hypothetical protein PR202_ga06118 [Eleusine coracana subsp. coracana]|uniref:Uncharacterized protein n=1 Tax=Eleusine coracana subsp. coracana TaxID=191504 RepID=A0AAV5BU60_ELECO|nr:hypothetical protein PR202_ga06118 [Eleusine coracana subsp. coracana]
MELEEKQSEVLKVIRLPNTERREAYVEERVQMILKKNPNAFDPKVAIVQEVAQSPAVEEANQVFVQSYSAAAVLSDKELSDVKGCSCQAIKCSDTYSSLQSMILPHHEEECHFLPIFRTSFSMYPLDLNVHYVEVGKPPRL